MLFKISYGISLIYCRLCKILQNVNILEYGVLNEIQYIKYIPRLLFNKL